MATYEIQPGRDTWADGLPRVRLMRHHNANQASVWDMTDEELLELYQVIHDHFVGRIRSGGTGQGAWATPPGTTMRGRVTREELG
jgi:hypothetical protein